MNLKKIYIFMGVDNEDISGLYELSKKGIRKINKEDNEKINSRDSVCLIYEPPTTSSRPTADYIHVDVHDISLSDKIIHQENFTKFGTSIINKVFPLKTNYSVFKISISIKQETMNRLFMEYEFSRIYPLSMFLWLIDSGISGIVTSEFNIFKMIDKNYKDCKTIEEIDGIIHSEEYINDIIDTDQLQVLLNRINSENDEDSINFNNFILDDLDENIFDEFELNNIYYNDFLKNLKTSDFFIEDNISNFYFSKVYKPYVIVGILIFLIANAILFWFDLKAKTDTSYLTDQLNGKKQIVSQLNNTIVELKKGNYYSYINKPEIKYDLKKIQKKLKEIIVTKDIESYDFEATPKGLILNYNIKGFENYQNIIDIYKKRKITYKVEKSGSFIDTLYKFSIKINEKDF